MKKLLTIFLGVIFALIVIPNLGNFVSAEVEGYSMACPLYSVDYINDNGTFDNIACFDNYDDAKAKMKENKDYVVRHANAYAETRIVAMNSGLVYSFPRGSSSTMRILSDRTDSSKTTTYVTARYEMTYVDTPYMSAVSGHAGEGYTEVIMNGFHGYADTEYLDFVPSKFIDNGLSIYLGGSYSGNSITSAAAKVVPNYYIIKQNGNYYDLEFHYHLSYPDSDGYVDEFTLKVDNAANYPFMTVGTKYYSDDGINFYSDYTKTNKVGTSYNYYQFLSLRSKTNISGSTMDSFLAYMRDDYTSSAMYNKGSSFVSLGDEYGCNAAIIYAMACQESAYGTSGYAKQKNNLFGWCAYDDSPDDATTFSSIDNCIAEQMGRNLRMFMDYSDYRYNGTYLGSKGSGFNLKYASDPYWGIKIASIYYRLDKFANNNNGNLTDFNAYTLGLINNFGANIYADQTCSKVLCSANYNSSRQVDNIVVVKQKIGNVYQIQFSNPISKSDNTLIANCEGVYGYSWSNSVAYIKCSDVELLFGKTVASADLSHESIINIDTVSFNGTNLTIKGIGAITNLDFNNASEVSHTITLVDMNDASKTYEFDAGKVDTNGFSMNDGFDYKYCGFETTIDLSQLDISSYYVNITTTCSSITKTVSLKTTDNSFRSIASNDDTRKYRFSTNQSYSYRVEIDIMNSPIDYSNIVKPSKRNSLVEYITPSFDEANNTISFSGYAMIYYLNYAESLADRYTLYLVDETNGTYKEISLENVIIDEAIKNQINSVYDINYISFKGTINLNELSAGDYTLILKVKTNDSNNTYYDYLEFVAEGRTMPSLSNNNINYQFHVSDVRNRLMLKVSEA